MQSSLREVVNINTSQSNGSREYFGLGTREQANVFAVAPVRNKLDLKVQKYFNCSVVKNWKARYGIASSPNFIKHVFWQRARVKSETKLISYDIVPRSKRRFGIFSSSMLYRYDRVPSPSSSVIQRVRDNIFEEPFHCSDAKICRQQGDN